MIVARTSAQLRALPPGWYIGIGVGHTSCWVTDDDPIATVQRRVNSRKLLGDPPRKADLDAIDAWLGRVA